MKTKLFMSAIVISLATVINGVAVAQTPGNNNTPKIENEAKKIQNIKKLIEITGSQDIQEQIVAQIFSSMKVQYPEVPAKVWDTFAAEFKPDELFDELIPIYAKYYTNEEIEQLIAFYDTPVGKKTIQILPQLSLESAELGVKFGQRIAERAIKKLEAEGYLQNQPRR